MTRLVTKIVVKRQLLLDAILWMCIMLIAPLNGKGARLRMKVEEAIRLLTGISAIDHEMPLGQAKCLFVIAQAEDGLSLTDISKKAGIGLATASRNVGALGNINRKREEGLRLIEAFEDPMERRKKIIRLTPKGKIAIRKILGE